MTNGQAELGLRAPLTEIAPVLRRAIELDPAALVRLRLLPTSAAAYVRLPFDVLVSRTVPAGEVLPTRDITVLARELLAWLDGDAATFPDSRDADWRGALPPATGWRRIDSVPDGVVRDLVRKGSLALQDAARREGQPGAQPRAEVADALLDSVVLTVTSDPDAHADADADADTGGVRAEVTLRALSALTRMGFLARGSLAHVDRHGRWIRVAAVYGSVFAEEPGGLSIASS
jgi:hypothetical protein